MTTYRAVLDVPLDVASTLERCLVAAAAMGLKVRTNLEDGFVAGNQLWGREIEVHVAPASTRSQLSVEAHRIGPATEAFMKRPVVEFISLATKGLSVQAVPQTEARTQPTPTDHGRLEAGWERAQHQRDQDAAEARRRPQPGLDYSPFGELATGTDAAGHAIGELARSGDTRLAMSRAYALHGENGVALLWARTRLAGLELDERVQALERIERDTTNLTGTGRQELRQDISASQAAAFHHR
jgi:hypothetical protein